MDEFFSDALPFQFWKNGDPTYNDNPECYRRAHQYIHGVSCSKTTPIRFRNKQSGQILGVFDSSDSIITSVPFNTTKELYDLDPLNTFTNLGPMGPAWTISSTPTVNTTIANPRSRDLSSKLKSYDTGEYTFRFSIDISGTSPTGTVQIVLRDYNFVALDIKTLITSTGSGGVKSGIINLSVSEIPYYVCIVLTNTSVSPGSTIAATVISLTQETVKNYVHSLSFTPADYNLCDKCGRLKLYSINSSPLPALETWLAVNGGWALGSAPSYSSPPSLGPSGIIHSNVQGYTPGRIKINWAVNISGSGTGVGTISFLKDGVSVIDPDDVTAGLASTGVLSIGSFVGSFEFSLTDTPDEVRFTFQNSTLGSKTYTLGELSVQMISDLDPSSYDWQTDLLNFSDNLGCVQEIQYKSSKDTFQIPYSSESPFFTISIPAQFSIPDYPTTQKELQLSNRYAGVAFSIKEKRLFQLVGEGLPGYMHKKIKLIFAHGVTGSVLISGKTWIMSDEYEEVKDRPDTFKPYIGKVWLTRKNYNSSTAI